jgi:hypothetical protein
MSNIINTEVENNPKTIKASSVFRGINSRKMQINQFIKILKLKIAEKT